MGCFQPAPQQAPCSWAAAIRTVGKVCSGGGETAVGTTTEGTLEQPSCADSSGPGCYCAAAPVMGVAATIRQWRLLWHCRCHSGARSLLWPGSPSSDEGLKPLSSDLSVSHLGLQLQTTGAFPTLPVALQVTVVGCSVAAGASFFLAPSVALLLGGWDCDWR